MDLRITNSSKDYGMQVYKISLYDFGCKEYHPFIITNKWDRIFIDLCDETPKGIIRQLLQLSVVKPIFDRSNISAKVMQPFCFIKSLPTENAGNNGESHLQAPDGLPERSQKRIHPEPSPILSIP